MLWYKAWLETRVRFLLSLAVITFLCAYNVYRTDHGVTSPVNLAYYFAALHTSASQLVIWWVLAVNLLTMGGLLREKAVGAASFTLALPVSRMRLAGARMAFSLIQAVALILIPWGATFVTGALAGKTHSLPQALFHFALMAGGGVLLYAITFLVSSVVEGEYTAPMVSFGVVMMIGLQLGDRSLRAFDPVSFMMGQGYYDSRAGLLVGPVPWMQIAIYALLALCLMVASVKALQMREF
jgi:ABC-2 type transport system permease protein